MKKNTKKMKLNLDDLQVDSFVTSAEVKKVTGGHTCDYSCGGTCNTCPGRPC